MSVQSVHLIASNTAMLPSNSVTTQPDFPRQTAIDALPTTESKLDKHVAPDILDKAVEEANIIFSQVRPDIKFVIDESTQDVVILLVEPATGDVINRYPTEQAMAISNAIIESQARLAEQKEVFRNTNNELLGLFVQQKT
jgi:uncharacterized FlaG/YvyC family protein